MARLNEPPALAPATAASLLQPGGESVDACKSPISTHTTKRIKCARNLELYRHAPHLLTSTK